MNKIFSFFAASNRYKHFIGGFIVATLAGSFYAAIYAAAVAASCLELKDRLYGAAGTGLTGSAPFSAASSQHSCFTSYSQWYGTKGFLKTTKIA